MDGRTCLCFLALRGVSWLVGFERVGGQVRYSKSPLDVGQESVGIIRRYAHKDTHTRTHVISRRRLVTGNVIVKIMAYFSLFQP